MSILKSKYVRVDKVHVQCRHSTGKIHVFMDPPGTIGFIDEETEDKLQRLDLTVQEAKDLQYALTSLLDSINLDNELDAPKSSDSEVPEHIQRLIKEYNELRERSYKLYEFISGPVNPIYISLSDIEKNLLNIQYQAMITYQKCLRVRLNDFYNKNNGRAT